MTKTPLYQKASLVVYVIGLIDTIHHPTPWRPFYSSPHTVRVACREDQVFELHPNTKPPMFESVELYSSTADSCAHQPLLSKWLRTK